MGNTISVLGNPGAGKSTILNCMITQRVFESGLSTGGLTRRMQCHHSQDLQWIDTPGLADPTMRAQAAAEIEAGLKQGQRHKLAFVVTMDAGRIRVQDIETINCVCAAIRTEFTFGLIINKLTPSAMQFLQRDDNLQLSKSLMLKQPSSVVMIPKVAMAEDEDNVLITDPAVREQLISFFTNLQPSFIRESEVAPIDIRDFDEKVHDLMQEFDAKVAEAEAARAEEQRRREEAEAKRAEEERRRKEAEAKRAEEQRGREEAEAKRAEEERKRREAEAQQVVKTEQEFDVQYGAEFKSPNQHTETHSCNHWLHSTKTWYFDVYMRPKHTRTRTKYTRRSGAVDYSNWTHVASVNEETRREKVRTSVP